METLQEQLNRYLTTAKASTQSVEERMKAFPHRYMEEPEQVLQAWALLTLALDTEADKQLTADFADKLYHHEGNFSTRLTEADYETWHKASETVLKRVGEFSGTGWKHLGYLHGLGRHAFMDDDLAFEYNERAARMGDPEAQAQIISFLGFGIFMDQNLRKCKAELERMPTDKAKIYAKLYYARVMKDEGELNTALQYIDDILKAIPQVFSAPEEEDTQHRLLSEAYDEKGALFDEMGRLDEAANYFQHGRRWQRPSMLYGEFLLKNHKQLDIPVEKALEALEKGFCDDDSAAAMVLGDYYSKQGKAFLPRALAWYEKAMYYGYAEGEAELIKKLLRAGKVVSPQVAKSLLAECIEHEPAGMFRILGEALLDDSEEEEDYTETAVKFFRAQADCGDEQGLYQIGILHEYGALNDEPDYDQAFGCYKAAFEKNRNPHFAARLGLCYRHGKGTPVNIDKAIELYRYGAEAGDKGCLTELALAYEEGDGVEADANMAVKYMQQAAEQGYPYAMQAMGDYYQTGYGSILPDMKEALRWYEKAAEQKHAPALLRLGDYYLYDYGNLKDYARAFDYYRRAAEQDHISAGIGICYEMGFGVEQNGSKAFQYYAHGADEGNKQCLYRLAMCYMNGVGVKVDKQEAFKQLLQCAEQEITQAEFRVGMCLLNGEGCTPDESKSINFLKRAAEKNHSEAMFELGNAYLTGRGVPENENEALIWYKRAAEYGHSEAKKLIVE